MMATAATIRWALTADVEKTQQRQWPLVPLQVESLPPAVLRLTVHFQAKKSQGQFHACEPGVKAHYTVALEPPPPPALPENPLPPITPTRGFKASPLPNVAAGEAENSDGCTYTRAFASTRARIIAITAVASLARQQSEMSGIRSSCTHEFKLANLV